MAVTLSDLYRDTVDSLYSYMQVKDTRTYLAVDALADATTLQFAANDIRSIRVGQILQMGTDDAVITELVRVKALDSTSSLITVARAVLGSTAAAWAAATCEVVVEPEFPTQAILREINNAVVALPPDIHAIHTSAFTADSVQRSYVLPNDVVGIVSVDWLPIGPDNTWQGIRRYRFDPVNKQVTVANLLEPGQPLKVTYRGYPTALAAGTDTLEDVGLYDELRQLVVWGALYRLLSARMAGRLVDTRAETPLNGQYRTADPVAAATRQVFALYTQALDRERERQRHRWPVRPYITF